MKRIHREIFKELSTTFGLVMGALLALILIGRMLKLKDVFLSQSISLLQMGELFLYLAPFFLLLLLPISTMLSVFLTFLRMSTDNELLALRAGGVSLGQMLVAPLLFCLLITAMDFGVSFWGVSWGMENFKSTVLEHARTKSQLILQPGVFNKEFPGLTLYARNVTPSGAGLEDVFVRDETRRNAAATIVAPKGTVGTDEERGQIVFLLEDGHIYRRQGNTFDVLGFSTYAVRLDLEKLFRGFRFDDDKPKEMSWNRLQRLVDDPDVRDVDEGNYFRKIKVEIQKRLALPTACFVLGLFALPFAFSFKGLRQYLGLVLSLGFFMVYYTMLSVGLSLGETGTLDPRVGLWVPNGLFLLLAIWGIRMAQKERFPRIFDRLRHISIRKTSKEEEQ
ncbi:LPS export ABC transporter permease LptF [Desulfohalovibrio reitneri]|uniref:LPS export ABC transporter permease LptF n=1 Tax=Desulfohalovibrio reitneri TaxID=1307759 RepID=UPI0004A707C5